jgi:hypothetical protein
MTTLREIREIKKELDNLFGCVIAGFVLNFMILAVLVVSTT